MIIAGCHYDNALMERFYNIIKADFYYLFMIYTRDVLYACSSDLYIQDIINQDLTVITMAYPTDNICHIVANVI